MRKILFLSISVLIISLLWTVAPVQAGEVSVLVNKLVEKGVLTPLEAQIILDETKAEVAKEIAEQKSYALPQWVQNVKLKGDFRLRYEYSEAENRDARNRGRIRYRLGVTSRVADVEVGAGLASGGSDPRSTNQSFDNTFDTGDIRLDYAYGQYDFAPWGKVIGGKFKRKAWLWAPTDLLWDGDINPEGGSLHLEHKLTKHINGFFNTGGWVLEESSSDTSDPYMYYFQAGATAKKGPFDAKVAGIYYGFSSLEGTTLTNNSGTNTTDGNGLKYNYDSAGVSAELGMKDPFEGIYEAVGLKGQENHRLAVFGDFIAAAEPEDDNTGFSVGLKYGDKKVKKPGNWRLKYIFAKLEMDAFPDAFPDSDRLSGGTNVKSHEVVFQYALKKGLILGLDYYRSTQIKGTRTPESILQADLAFKF